MRPFAGKDKRAALSTGQFQTNGPSAPMNRGEISLPFGETGL